MILWKGQGSYSEALSREKREGFGRERSLLILALKGERLKVSGKMEEFKTLQSL